MECLNMIDVFENLINEPIIIHIQINNLCIQSVNTMITGIVDYKNTLLLYMKENELSVDKKSEFYIDRIENSITISNHFGTLRVYY